jgi:chitinase
MRTAERDRQTAAAVPVPRSAASPTPTPSPTGGSCAATWNNATAHTSSNQVSYDGDNWTANQWTYDEVPDGAAGAWNNDGPC